MLDDFNINDFQHKSPDCPCGSFLFIYIPDTHGVHTEINIVYEMLTKGPKYHQLRP